jgi:hypothetical protein
MVVTVKFAVLWDVRPYDLYDMSERFGGTCLLHLQGRRVDVTQCDSVDRFQLFGGSCCLHLQGRIIDITPYSFVDCYECFEGTSCLQLQGLRVVWRRENRYQHFGGSCCLHLQGGKMKVVGTLETFFMFLAYFPYLEKNKTRLMR